MLFSVIIGSIWVVLTRRVRVVRLRIWDPSLPYAVRRLHFDKIIPRRGEGACQRQKPYGVWVRRPKLSMKGEPGAFRSRSRRRFLSSFLAKSFPRSFTRVISKKTGIVTSWRCSHRASSVPALASSSENQLPRVAVGCDVLQCILLLQRVSRA